MMSDHGVDVPVQLSNRDHLVRSASKRGPSPALADPEGASDCSAKQACVAVFLWTGSVTYEPANSTHKSLYKVHNTLCRHACPAEFKDGQHAIKGMEVYSGRKQVRTVSLIDHSANCCTRTRLMTSWCAQLLLTWPARGDDRGSIPDSMTVDEAVALEGKRMAIILKDQCRYKLSEFKLSKLTDAAVAVAKGTGKQKGWGRLNTILQGCQPSDITVTGLQKDRITFVTDEVGLAIL